MGNVLSHSSNDRSLFIRVGTISRFLPVSGFIVSFLHATLTTLQGACVSGNGDATATASGSTAPASGEVEAPLSYLVHLLGTTRRSGKPSDLDSVTILPDYAGSGYSFPVCVEHIFNSFADIGSLSWITHHIPHEIGLLDMSWCELYAPDDCTEPFAGVVKLIVRLSRPRDQWFVFSDTFMVRFHTWLVRV